MDKKYIIVLATERRDEEGKFPDFEKDKKDPSKKIYTGGNVRMQAALEARKKYPDAEFVMLGGVSRDGLSKAEDMADFMRENFPNIKLRIINSKPSTWGNLVALFESMKSELASGNFVLLINDYHTQRVAELWKQLKDIEYRELPEPEFLTVSKLGLKEVTETASEEYLLRLQRETEGLRALKEGTYVEKEVGRTGEYGVRKMQ